MLSNKETKMIFYDNIPEFLVVARMLGLEPHPTVHYMRVPLETRWVCSALKLPELRKIVPEANNPLHEPLPASPLMEGDRYCSVSISCHP